MNNVVLSKALGIRSRVIDSLELAVDRLCKSCEASEVTKVIVLAKFVIRLSQQFEEELIQFVPEDYSSGSDNPPDYLDDLR